MGRIILVIGGAGSGKSEYAENLCGNLYGEEIHAITGEEIHTIACEKFHTDSDSSVIKNSWRSVYESQDGDKNKAPRKIYLATMKNDGSEAYYERVSRHRKLREGKGFITIEKESGVSGLPLMKNDTVLLEDLSNLLSNLMFSDENIEAHSSEGVENSAGTIFHDILSLSHKVKNIVVVMNDVFRDGMCYDNSTEKFLEELGKTHELLSHKADMIVRVIYGIPIIYKISKETQCLTAVGRACFQVLRFKPRT